MVIVLPANLTQCLQSVQNDPARHGSSSDSDDQSIYYSRAHQPSVAARPVKLAVLTINIASVGQCCESSASMFTFTSLMLILDSHLPTRPQLLSLFSSTVYYKVAPPSERNELNLYVLKVSRPVVDGFSRNFQRLVEKLSGQNKTALFSR